jgi:hypothetical protein
MNMITCLAIQSERTWNYIAGKNGMKIVYDLHSLIHRLSLQDVRFLRVYGNSNSHVFIYLLHYQY